MKCLPHPITISKWYRDVECTSGFNEESLNAITKKVKEEKQKNGNKPVLCNLVMDEMKIKKSIENVNGKEYGYVDVGKDIDGDEVPAAENALVVMVVCENSKWKIPVSHYFINVLAGEEKANIVLSNMKALHKTGITLTSITFDGLQSNLTMCTILGAKMCVETSSKQFFFHPITKEKVYIICDGCHVLKLVRNSLAVEDLFDLDGNRISWSYLKALVEFQEINGLHAGTKIRRPHIDWQQNKMNVKLAAQSLSESVSVALRCMRDDFQNDNFKNVEGTAKFCSIINEAFDILNSRELWNKNPLKVGILASNVDAISHRVKDIISYIKSLKTVHGIPIIQTRKKTGFVGFIISLQNVVNIYNDFYKCNSGYLLTYKLSQDHLETFFSAVRSRGGYSNNPTCYQFINILKKLLIHADIKGSESGNCEDFNDTEILKISSENSANKKKKDTSLIDNALIVLSKNDDLSEQNILGENDFYGAGTDKKYIDSVVEYLAGFITRSLLKRSKCYSCPLLLTNETSNSAILNKKNRGGLIKPSDDIVLICKILERNFRLYYKSKIGIFHETYKKCLSSIPKNVFPINHSDAPEKHRAQLLHEITKMFLRIRINHYEKQKRQSTKKVRRVFTKLILFRNE